MTAMELLLLIKDEKHYLYYDPVNLYFTNEFVSQKELNRVLAIKKKEDILINDVVHNIMLPKFNEIDHESIMRYFVRECIEDKEIRKTLFYILRRDDYVTPFINKLKELELYDDFFCCCGSLYDQIIEEWAEKNGIDLSKKNEG